jgi:hypothetical protein
MSHMPMDDGIYVRDKRIETFQIEPSMGCQLECPGCIPRAKRKAIVRKTSYGQMTLDAQVLYKIVDDLHRAGVKVDKFDMQGHGEPTLHKEIWSMCGYIADLYPRSVVSICTHANTVFKPYMVHSGVNEMLFAIDGVDHTSYSPYRVHGQFDQAFNFMRQFSQLANDEAPNINRVWKYVVFSHNDSNQQLLRAQELALDAKITTLRFVLTQLGPTSSRIMDGSEIPILDPSLNIVIDNYRIKLEQLKAALDRLRRSVWYLNLGVSKSWAKFLSHSIYRLFRTAPLIPQPYIEVIEEFRGAIGGLPASEFGRFDTLVADTVIGAETNLSFLHKEVQAELPMRSSRKLAPSRASESTVEQCRSTIASVDVDEIWYIDTYPDVGEAIRRGTHATASDHFRQLGYYEERLPFCPEVDEEFYLTEYPDVLEACERGDVLNATAHFVASGYREGRRAFPMK